MITRNVNLNKCLCDDKNGQSAKCVQIQQVKTAMPQSRKSTSKKCQVKSKSKVTHTNYLARCARQKIGTQPEVTRNCQDCTSRCCYPSGSTNNMCPDFRNFGRQSNHTQLAKADLHKKSQVYTRLQLKTSKYRRDTKTQA